MASAQNPRQEPARARTERRNRDAAVVDAAIAVMSERGYAATTIQEVADRVGVLKGSLYYYFSSKEELLFRILRESHEQSTRDSAEVAALGLSALEELCEYLRRSSLWYLENIERANIYFAEWRHLTGERLAHMQRLGKNFQRHIVELLSAGQLQGDVRTDLDARLLGRYVLGALNEVRAWPGRSTVEFGNDEMVDAFVAITRAAVASPAS